MLKNLVKSLFSSKDLFNLAMDKLLGNLSDSEKEELKKKFKEILVEAGRAYIASKI